MTYYVDACLLLFFCFSFQDAMEVLAENYEFNMIEGSCLAFRKAASVLKSLPYMVRRLEDIQDLPCFGQHTKSVAEVGLTLRVQMKLIHLNT